MYLNSSPPFTYIINGQIIPIFSMQLYPFSNTSWVTNICSTVLSLFYSIIFISINKMIIKDDWVTSFLHSFFLLHLFVHLFMPFNNIKHLFLAAWFVDTVDTKESSIVSMWAHNTGPVTATWFCSAAEEWVLYCTRYYRVQKAMNEKSLQTVFEST